MLGSKYLSSSSAISSSASQYMTPEGSNSPRKINATSPYFATGNFSPNHPSNSGFNEPYENYETESESLARLKNQKSEEPYDDYHIAGFNAAKREYEQSREMDGHRVFWGGR